MSHHVESWYDLNGAMLRIDAPDDALTAPLLTYLGELKSPPAGRAADFHLVIARGPPDVRPRPDARLLYEGALPEGHACRISAEESWRWLVVPDRLFLRFSLAGRLAHMHVAAGAEALVGGTPGIQAIDAALICARQVLVHAAALQLPDRLTAIVLLARSGAGKTTTALALAAQGFPLMTDDAAVLADDGGPAGARHGVCGLPRPLKVHRRTAELLPEVGALLNGNWNADGEQGLTRGRLASAIAVSPPRPVPLRALLVLGPRVAGEHRLGAMAKADLLVHFASDNVFRTSHGVLGDELARYQRIARIVSELPAFELNVGSDLRTLGRRVLDVLG